MLSYIKKDGEFMYINIKPLLKQKQMSRYQLAQKIGVTYPTITAIYNSSSSSIKLDILEKLCRTLECTPNDILLFDNDNISQNNICNNSAFTTDDFMNLPVETINKSDTTL